jgi:hypothetical protein
VRNLGSEVYSDDVLALAFDLSRQR